ncbi:MAG: translation initiation factor IF-2, partial [Bacteroidales bacterium]|nr:translation initiation factor IF-2 [Bacteroidales bacterium]
MAEIRLIKLTKQFNIGLGTLVDFLKAKGIEVDGNPNSKVSEEEVLPLLSKEFGSELKAKQEAEKTTIKYKEIIEGASRKKATEEEDEAPVELVIKSNSLAAAAPAAAKEKPAPEEKPVEIKPEPVKAAPKETVHIDGPKVTGKIDLSQFDKKKPAAKEEAPAPVETPAAEKPAPAPMEAPVEEAPKAEPAEPVEEEVKPAEPREVKIEVEKLKGPVVVDKIDLSQFDKKKKAKKRERVAPGASQKVDVTKVQSENHPARKEKNAGNGGRNGAPAQNQPGKGRHAKGQDRFAKPALTEAEQDEMQKEIQKQIKETYARMNEAKSKNQFGAKHRKEKREAAANKVMEDMELQQLESKVLKVTEFVTVNDLATLMNNTPVTKVIAACMNLGLMVAINQRLDAEALVLVAEEFGYEVEFVTAEITEAIANDEEEGGELVSRPPVITVMGHVDHGKTSLLDYIRKANVIAGEAGGITQHIGAYNVTLEDGRRITFLDTPGHEAFTAMRARGAKMTDLAIIIIAADDAIMPQTVEAINHAQAAGVPMVFAINKIDKPGANPEKIREQLSQMNILVEDWGGKYQCQEISAKKGINVDLLLEKVLLEADLLDLKACPTKRASGAVIESSLDKGRGYLATVLVQNGTMRVGDVLLTGCYTGRIKAMFNERGQKVTEAGPSTPVSVLGLNGAPTAGETFNVMADEKEAKDIANKREQLIRIQGIKTQKHMTLEEIGRR